MALWDIQGKRVNWGDRITRNALFVLCFAVYAFQFIAPYFIPTPKPPLDPGLIKGLESIVTGVFWYMIGRNQSSVDERVQKELPNQSKE